MKYADYADDPGLLTNTPAQVESHLLNQEQVAGGIDLYVNPYKTEYMYLKHKRSHLSTKW